MASITRYKKKSGGWAWKFQAYTAPDPKTGKKHKVTRQNFATKSEAKLRAARFETEQARHGFSVSSQLTFEEVYKSWFEQYKNTVKESTWVKTRDNFRLHIIPRFGDKVLSKITPVDCQTAINEWFEAGFAKYRQFLGMVSRIFKYAIRMDLAYSNPTVKVITPVNRDQPASTMKDNYYTRDQLHTFLTAAKTFSNPQAFVLFRLLAFSGMRRGEALALTWSDINFAGATITVNKTVTQGDGYQLMVNSPKTYTSIRTASVDLATIEVLRRWQWDQRQTLFTTGVKSDGADQLIFTSDSNQLLQLTYPQKWLDWIVAAYNKQPDKKNLKRITVHGFRHTYATLAHDAGIDAKDVQTQLGHKHLATTMDIYTSSTEKAKSEIASKFAHYADA